MCLKFPNHDAFFHALQNRAYAVSQLGDLHQKLSRAQANVANTQAQAPLLKDKEPSNSKVRQVNFCCFLVKIG